MTADESAARQQFEALSDKTRNKYIGVAVNTASGIYTGFSLGGPIGAAVGGALGLLTGLWGLKSYRARVYAELDAAGQISRPRTRYRSIMERHISDDPAFLRYPHGAEVGFAVIEVLTSQFPRMSDEEVNKQAYAIVKTFDEFRRRNPDVPIEIAGEVILLLNGIRRNELTGEYETFTFEIPAEPPPIIPPAERKPVSQVNLAWGLAAVALIIFMFRRNK